MSTDRAAVDPWSACADIVVRFAYYVDHREFGNAVRLFHEDGVFERHDLTARGHAELAAIWADRPASIITRHLCCPPCSLEIGADRILSATNCTLYHVTHEGDGLPQIGNPTAIVTFYDEFRPIGTVWRLSHRKAVPALIGRH